MYYDNAEQGSFGGYVNQNVVTIAHSNPSNSKLVWTISPDSEYHPEAITQKKYYTDAEFAAGVTIGDLLNKYYNYRALTGSMLTMTQMCSVSGTTATINGFCLIEGELVDEDAITVTYDGNKPAAATGTVSGVPANGSGSKDGNTPFTVSSDVPTLAGYKFNG